MYVPSLETTSQKTMVRDGGRGSEMDPEIGPSLRADCELAGGVLKDTTRPCLKWGVGRGSG